LAYSCAHRLRQGFTDFVDAVGTGHASNLGAVLEHDDGWPQLDLERAAERTAGAVLDLDVLRIRVILERARDQRLAGAALATPVGAEVESDEAGQRVDRATLGLGGFVRHWVTPQ
jgi:hypothetical protein